MDERLTLLTFMRCFGNGRSGEQCRGLSDLLFNGWTSSGGSRKSFCRSFRARSFTIHSWGCASLYLRLVAWRPFGPQSLHDCMKNHSAWSATLSLHGVMTFNALGSTSKRTGVVPIGWPSTCTDKRSPDEISTLFAANISIFGS